MYDEEEITECPFCEEELEWSDEDGKLMCYTCGRTFDENTISKFFYET